MLVVYCLRVSEVSKCSIVLNKRKLQRVGSKMEEAGRLTKPARPWIGIQMDLESLGMRTVLGAGWEIVQLPAASLQKTFRLYSWGCRWCSWNLEISVTWSGTDTKDGLRAVLKRMKNTTPPISASDISDKWTTLQNTQNYLRHGSRQGGLSYRRWSSCLGQVCRITKCLCSSS